MNKCKLSDITLQIYDGKHGGCSKQPNSGFYFISVKDIDGLVLKYENAMQIPEDEFNEIFSRTSLEVGDTLYANTGDTIGKSVFVTDGPYVSKTAFQKSVAVVKPNKEKVYPRYLYYLMKYETPRLRAAASGSGQKNLLLDTMRNFETSIHDMPDQTKIVGVLTPIDEKIKKNNVIADNLEGLVKFIYDYWFVQFDFPDQNGMPYKTSGGAMEWNSELKREIPCGWKVKKLSDLACEGKDCPYTSPQCVPTFDLSVMPSNNMLLADFNESKNFSTNLFVLKQGDILFGSIRPYLRKAGIAPCDGAVAGTVHVIRPRRKEDYNFLATTLCSERMFKYATTVSQGTKMPVVTIDSLFDYKIAYDETVAEKFNGFDIKGIFSRIAIENHELAALRDFLLPMLMNGQVKIKTESSESGASPTQSKDIENKKTGK